ncbi:hypothetical protein MHK_006595 [Candidatus Magnetomorum sp. HK-1]|nr:hypothetical protein MHK_006595 [Candidatus Magnetomorum sp. HK-1]
MEITGENFAITYDSKSFIITIQGALRLYGSDGYSQILKLFDNVVDESPEIITLDLKGLHFLNSSGINAISKFVIKIRNKKLSKLFVKGAKKYSWQTKSLKNLKRLMPDIILEFD